jgi:hypothetical protein
VKDLPNFQSRFGIMPEYEKIMMKKSQTAAFITLQRVEIPPTYTKVLEWCQNKNLDIGMYI